MSDIITKLKDLERKIRSLQQEKARQEGRKQQLLDRLKNEFKLDSVEQAIIELKKLQTEVETYEKILKEISINMENIINKAEHK